VARAAILDNLWDEEHGEANHRELWLRFAEGMGVDRDDVRSSSSNSATQAMLATYWQACTEAPVAAGVAAVYAYERQVPAVARAKVDGLKARYDVHDPRTLAFFEVHATLDEDHSAAERAIIARHGEGHEEEVLAATSAALDAWWSFLDAVTPEEA
jgi:pyrroloquinoline-quinone synthase